MLREIFWSPLSVDDLENNISYLKDNWPDEVGINYLSHIDKLINQIASNPKQFPIIHKTKKIRKCVVTKHNTIFYREKNSKVEILRVFDTRQKTSKRFKTK
jgi:plasmid stabilization system protein ParE